MEISLFHKHYIFSMQITSCHNKSNVLNDNSMIVERKKIFLIKNYMISQNISYSKW